MDETRYREAEQRLWQSLGVVPTERMLRLEQNDVTVRVQEVGHGPAVVFVHGANTSGSSWASLAARLPQFRCVLLDRPGTGLSQPLRSALTVETLPRFADTLVVDVLDALALGSAHVVATSLGGYVGLRTAAAHPDRISRMVQFSWPLGATVARLPAFMRLTSVPGVGRLIAALPPTEGTVRMTFRRVGHGRSLEAGRITRQDIDCYLALLRDTDTLRNEMALGRALISPVRGLGRLVLPESLLASIHTPTHFLWGEHDPFGGANTARELVERMPDATFEVVSGAGHAPWLDDLDHCARITTTFLEGRD